ncbi:hypothetical protein [Methanobrevibacter millerae]|uniref:Phage integrase family protein n=1 Tax=Methanobrevibacter millerae TaxID=230361 RepID=A0A0U2L7P1_9EURY|nr:hypothetical protein [Methanobrevibacter millerae]ALT69950.1 phage integrase family protein [Methanobrevibacter millerae]
MSIEGYDVRDSPKLKRFCLERNLGDHTVRKYYVNLKRYVNFCNKTLEELLEEADEEEDRVTRQGRRKIRERLIDFRVYLKENYATNTVLTNMTCVTTFYKHFDITIPELPRMVYNESPNSSIEFKDLPTIDDIKTAIENSKNPKHKALYLFMACNGTSRNEISKFKYSQFLSAIQEYFPDVETPQDIVNALDGKCDELDIIPIFKMYREKTRYHYYTAISPECVQFCINYIKQQGLGLKEDTPFFQLSADGVSGAFKLMNNKMKWGKKGSIDFFSPHRIRKFNASAIEDTDFANYIQGRKPNKIRETYFKKDIENVREEYKKHMHKFNIYAHYDVMINSEAYKKMKKQIEDERRKHEDENKKLRKEYEHKINQLELQNSLLSGQINNIETQMIGLVRANEYRAFIKYVREDDFAKEHGLMDYAIDIYESRISNDENFHPSIEDMDIIINQAYNRKINDNRLNAKLLSQTSQDYGEIYSYIESKANEYLDRRGFELIPALRQVLNNRLKEYALEIDENMAVRDNWEDLIDDRRISRIVAEVTKSIM